MRKVFGVPEMFYVIVGTLVAELHILSILSDCTYNIRQLSYMSFVTPDGKCSLQ